MGRKGEERLSCFVGCVSLLTTALIEYNDACEAADTLTSRKEKGSIPISSLVDSGMLPTAYNDASRDMDTLTSRKDR